MDESKLEEIKSVILKEIEKTKNSISDYEEITKPIEPDNAIGRISRMDAINNKSVVEAALRQSREKLQKLEYVLTRIGNEGFGICAKCNNPIPIGRILLMPESRFCVHCA